MMQQSTLQENGTNHVMLMDVEYSQQTDPIELSIVMPCLNEAETLATCIEKAQTFLKNEGIHGEILIADNGSTDGSQEIARQMNARLIEVSKKGYGSALSGGIQAARGAYIIMGDSDDSYNFLDLMPFVEQLRAGFDLVMGNRFLGTILPGAMPPLHRHLGNPVLTTIGRLFFRSSIGDFHCGLRGFRRDSILRLNLNTAGMEFASEMIIKATLSGYKITEIPIILYQDGRNRSPHLRSWRDGWRHLRFMLLYSPRWLFFYPGLLLMLLGFLASLWLITGPKTFGMTTFDIHTLLYASISILIGFQAVIFSLFSSLFAFQGGFLPVDRRLEKILNMLNLERLLLIGLLFVLIGIIGSISALHYWQTRSFGPLDPTSSFRTIIPATTAFALGCQIIFSSFFLSFLKLERTSL